MKKKVGVISPSNNVLGIFPNRMKTGVKNLEELGLEVVFLDNAVRSNDYTKKSVEERVEEINKMIQEDVEVIFSSIGGYTSIEILDKIDYDTIKNKNITFCGFSDITAILLGIYSKTKKEVLYGPVYTVNLCDYGGVDEYTKDSLLKVLKGTREVLIPSTYQIIEYIDWKDLEEKEIIKRKEFKSNDWKVLKEGEATGKLIGGNLATLLLILGTEYLPVEEFNDSILFIEDCETNINEFCSYLESLRLKNVLSKVKGILIGKFDTKEMNEEIEDFLKDYMSTFNVPIIYNMDFGHVFPIMTLPIGRDAYIKCNKQEIKFEIKEKK